MFVHIMMSLSRIGDEEVFLYDNRWIRWLADLLRGVKCSTMRAFGCIKLACRVTLNLEVTLDGEHLPTPVGHGMPSAAGSQRELSPPEPRSLPSLPGNKVTT